MTQNVFGLSFLSKYTINLHLLNNLVTLEWGNKKTPTIVEVLCGWRDSNPQAVKHLILSLACLPGSRQIYHFLL